MIRNKFKLRIISFLSIVLFVSIFLPLDRNDPGYTIYKIGSQSFKPYESHVSSKITVIQKWEVRLPFIMVFISGIIAFLLSINVNYHWIEYLTTRIYPVLILLIGVFWLFLEINTFGQIGILTWIISIFIGFFPICWLGYLIKQNNSLKGIFSICTSFFVCLSIYFWVLIYFHSFHFRYILFLIEILLGLILSIMCYIELRGVKDKP